MWICKPQCSTHPSSSLYLDNILSLYRCLNKLIIITISHDNAQTLKNKKSLLTLFLIFLRRKKLTVWTSARRFIVWSRRTSRWWDTSVSLAYSCKVLKNKHDALILLAWRSSTTPAATGGCRPWCAAKASPAPRWWPSRRGPKSATPSPSGRPRRTSSR